MVTPPIGSGQSPRFFELDSDTFQNLCRDIFYHESNISTVDVYGLQGETQFGIDLLATRKDSDELETAQCKCYENFPPAKIRKACDEFLKHFDYWSQRNVKKFILMVACDLSKANRQEQIIKQKQRFANLGLEFETWSSAHIKTKLAPHRRLVNEYLGDYWVPLICGETSASPQLELNQGSHASQIIFDASLDQIDRLSGVISVQIDDLLSKLKEEWRAGRRIEVLAGLRNIKSNPDIWIALPGELKAQILRLEAAFELQISDNTQMATILADEAKSFAPNVDDSRVRALIALIDYGPEYALDLVTGDGVDDVNLKAALNLGLGNIETADVLLRLENSDGDPNAETIRLQALVSLLNKDIPEAVQTIQLAIEREPDWVPIKHAKAVIYYYSSLSPAVLPGQTTSWPPPVPWSLVKTDDQSVNRNKIAAASFKELTAYSEEDEQLNSKAWLIACLANDFGQQEKAEEYCANLLSNDPVFHPAIAWVLARRYSVNLQPSLTALENLVEKETADIQQIISLADCYVHLDRPNDAVNLFERTQDKFFKDHAELWTVLQIRALASSGKIDELSALMEKSLKPEARHAISMSLRYLAEADGNWKQLEAHLEYSFEVTGDENFLLELCELKSDLEDWEYSEEKTSLHYVQVLIN